MRIPDYMEDPDHLETPGQLSMFARVIVGTWPALDGQPIPSASRKVIELTTAHAIVRFSVEQAEALRVWLTTKLGG